MRDVDSEDIDLDYDGFSQSNNGNEASRDFFAIFG